MKYGDVLNGIEACALTWVEEGVTFRDLTPEEAAHARKVQAAERDVLAFAELPGLIYQPSMSGIEASRRGYELVKQANEIAATACYKSGCPILDAA